MTNNTSPFSVSTLQAELATEHLNLSQPQLVVIAAGEQELATSGQHGFVDLATGAVVVQFDNWLDFTARFMYYCQTWGFDPNYCQLALAMAKADRNLQTLDDYLNLARTCTLYYYETGNPRLHLQKLTLETSGWSFTFHGGYWLAITGKSEIRGASLAETLASIHTHEPSSPQGQNEPGATPTV